MTKASEGKKYVTRRGTQAHGDRSTAPQFRRPKLKLPTKKRSSLPAPRRSPLRKRKLKLELKLPMKKCSPPSWSGGLPNTWAASGRDPLTTIETFTKVHEDNDFRLKKYLDRNRKG